MKKLILTFFVLPLIFSISSCLKDNSCQPKTVQSEEGAIQAYAAANGISATRHSSGLYYEILNPGSGPVPTVSSNCSVKYTGKLLDGTVFDSQTASPVSFILGQTIHGWQLGLPLIQKAGSIRLIIPSSLAYGCTGYGTIPANSILYFQIDLVDVQ